MPTAKIIGPYRFHFFSGDRDERSHIHVQRDDCEAKFWLKPARLHANLGFNRTELAKLKKLVAQNQDEFDQKWHDYFDAR
jgi:hypothetical protein